MRKIPIFLSTLMLVEAGLTVALTYPVRADGGGHGDVNLIGTPNALNDELHIYYIEPSNDTVRFKFNENTVKPVGIQEIYVATYDYNKVTEAEADARAVTLGVDDTTDWASNAQNLGYYIPWAADTSASINFRENGTLVGAPQGILYYAVAANDYTDPNNPQLYWIRGKLSYRECMYNSTIENPYAMACNFDWVYGQETWAVRRNNPEYFAGEVYKSWSEEFGEILTGELKDLEVRVEAWGGTEEEKQPLLERFAKIKQLAVDAVMTEDLRDKSDELAERLQKKPVKEDDKKEEPTVPDPSVDPDNPEGLGNSGNLGTTGDGSGNSGNFGTSDSGSGDMSNGNDVDKPILSSGMGAVGPNGETTTDEEVKGNLALADKKTEISTLDATVPRQVAMAIKEQEGAGTEQEKEENAARGYLEALEEPKSAEVAVVPALSEETRITGARRNVFWAIIGLGIFLLGLLAYIGWRKWRRDYR